MIPNKLEIQHDKDIYNELIPKKIDFNQIDTIKKEEVKSLENKYSTPKKTNKNGKCQEISFDSFGENKL